MLNSPLAEALLSSGCLVRAAPGTGQPVDDLPDLVGPRPRIVFCGLACAERTSARDHYYAGSGNNFWRMLQASGLVPEPLRPEDDESLVEHGLGLTDLVRHSSTTPPTWAVADLVAKLESWQPGWLAFTSKTVAQGAARALRLSRPQLGIAAWDLAGAGVFVLPGTSGANQRKDYDGRPDRLSWWQDLAALVGAEAPATRRADAVSGR